VATYTIQSLDQDGLDVSNAALTAVSTSDDFPNNGKTFLFVDNQQASSVTVTISAVRSVVQVGGYGSVAISDIVVTIPATKQYAIIVPYASHSAAGTTTVTYSSTTSVKAAAVRLETI
jgi:hypothetical protein